MAGYMTVNRGDDESKAEMLEKALIALKMGTPL